MNGYFEVVILNATVIAAFGMSNLRRGWSFKKDVHLNYI
jgi:hypothetical protein